MGRIFPDKTCSGIAGCFYRASHGLSFRRGVFALGLKLPTGKLALVIACILVAVGSISPAIFAQGKGRIAAPGEPTPKAQKVGPESLKKLKVRGKKKRKFRRRKKLPRITPEQKQAADALKTQQQQKKAHAQQPFEAKKLVLRYSLGIAYNQLATTGERFRNATVEPGVHMELSFALNRIDTAKGGGSAFLGVQLMNVNGATIYDDVFFRYSYNYVGPSLSYRYFTSGERKPAAGEAQAALNWSFGLKGAVLMVQPNQRAQSNAKAEELEFGGSRALTFDAPGLLGELSASYHVNNALAVNLAGGSLLATEKTYTFFVLGVAGYL